MQRERFGPTQVMKDIALFPCEVIKPNNAIPRLENRRKTPILYPFFD